jgi:hypothetical protein
LFCSHHLIIPPFVHCRCRQRSFRSQNWGRYMTISSRQTIPCDTYITIFKAKKKLLLHDTWHAHPRAHNHCHKQEPREFFYASSYWGPLSFCSSEGSRKYPCAVTGREREDLAASGRWRRGQGAEEKRVGLQNFYFNGHEKWHTATQKL